MLKLVWAPWLKAEVSKVQTCGELLSIAPEVLVMVIDPVLRFSEVV
jgi:hypothetical protein